MPGLIKLIGFHGSVVFATPEKAERLIAIQGYQVAPESAPEAVSEPATATPARKAGRPKKV
jgi:hypothetical protein